MDNILFYMTEYGFYVFLAWILLYIMGRRQPRSDDKKTLAMILQSVMILVLFTAAVLINEKKWNPHFIWGALGAEIILMIILRKRFFPYPKKCKNCDATIAWKVRWIESNENCDLCRPKVEEQPKEES